MEVTEVVPEFADAFPFDSFNRMQREALPAILDSDENVVAAAPTASGKTALAELAICRVLEAGGTALFVAPLRALTNEREAEWERFEDMGYSVYVVTGERDLDPRRAARADVLVMTPEKADSATRNHDSPRYDFVTDVDLCVIDEVHLLDADTRGAVLEVVVSRLRRLCDPRIVALSATMPNIDDVADWLDAPPETTFTFGDAYRPVELHAGVEPYTRGDNAWADKYRRLYTALDLARPHLADGQALIFVASRQDTVRAAEKAREELATDDVGTRGDYDTHQATDRLENKTLRECVLDGVGFHHAGLSRTDKAAIEDWFRDGVIDVLFSTSTLAWGVNLPARCVVIRDTKLHDPLEGEVEMSPIDILQMLGRAGRPGYDDVGYGYVVCSPEDTDRYQRLLENGVPVESRLPDRLAEHLNAEIAMGTVTDIDDVPEWLDTTYYAARARRNPTATDDPPLRDRARTALESLIDRGFVTATDLDLAPTPLGRLTSNFYLELATATRYQALPDTPTTADILTAIAEAAEFDSVTLRSDETTAVATTVETAHLDAGARKVLAVLQSSMDGDVPPALRDDAWAIRSNAARLFAALAAFCERFRDAAAANKVRRVAARVDTGVPETAVGLTAIDGVGAGRAHRLSDAGFATPAAIRAATVEELTATGFSASVAERIHSQARRLPHVTVDWADVPNRIPAGANTLEEVTITNDGTGTTASITVTVNGTEMTSRECHLDDQVTVPIGIYGADADTLTYRITTIFPEYPLTPTTSEHTVTVTD